MKRLVEYTEGDGLESLIGKTVQVWCMNYIYSGRLVGVNDADICLSDSFVVYETGPLAEPGFKDAQPTGLAELFIRTAAIESYGIKDA